MRSVQAEPNIVRRYGSDSIANAPVEACYVDGDIRSATQDPISLPTATGRRQQLRPARRYDWSDVGGGAAGGPEGALARPLRSIGGAAAGFGTARGGRLNLISPFPDATPLLAVTDNWPAVLYFLQRAARAEVSDGHGFKLEHLATVSRVDMAGPYGQALAHIRSILADRGLLNRI